MYILKQIDGMLLQIVVEVEELLFVSQQKWNPGEDILMCSLVRGMNNSSGPKRYLV